MLAGMLEPYGCWTPHPRLEMPQTVPSAGFTPPCDYSNFAADCFDLSLLPSPDGEVPYSPVSLQQVMSFYSDPTTSPPSMFPAGGPDEYHAHLKPTTAAGSSGAAPAGSPVTTMAAQVQCSTDPYHFPLPATATIKEEPVHYHSRDAACSYMPSPYSSGGPMSASPMPSSPAGSTSSSASYQRSVSPVVKPEQSLDLQEILQESRYLRESLKQKQERGPLSCAEDASGKLAPPPPHPFAGLQVPKKEQEPVAGPSSAPEPCAGPGPGPSSAADHRLLREVLRDTSFQRRYNLKPFDFAGLAPGFMASEAGPSARPSLAGPPPPPHAHAHPADASPPPHAHAHAHAPEVKLEEGEALQLSRERMEPVLSLAIEQLRKDVGDTCTVLGISPDPTRWAASDVRAWLLWTLRQYALPMIPIEYFDMDGPALAALSEHDFHQRAPQCGSTLYAQLEIWKAACQDLDIQWTNSSTSSSSTGDEPSDDEEDMEAEASPAGTGAGGGGAAPGGSGASGATGAAGVAGAGASAAAPGGGKAPSSRATGSAAGGAGGGAGGGSGGSHIHLWQFLKELLAAPQLHGSCIRWLDRSKGVFKIEDSVRVARLWGKRKNRPAMNYDKLSRSIRQYYKKGIMKKTERSQRLVYQFCHPYSL
ncbi:hypothetical protein R5R35_007492 [Gryllus longicercus]|uniref:DNA-binding protein D-ETS-4 n=1 Tax=Gryllus longicercus TaxID=2509291 RepID=A0AAN9VR13_9ORTH